MVDHRAIELACRARLQTLLVCTTGSATLAGTATGYARTTGSFVTDGFEQGMELAASGFSLPANNGPRTVTGVTDLALSCAGCAAEAAGAGRTLTVGLPARAGWENVDFAPAAGRPSCEEHYLPGPAAVSTIGPNGRIVSLPEYVINLYATDNQGIGALAAYATAILTLFPPELVIGLANGDLLRVRGDQAPFRGQLLPDQPGWAVLPVTIPLRCYSLNSI